MKTYFSTFITGFGEIVESQLIHEIKDIKIKELLDGLVVYQTKVPLKKIRSIRFFNNNYKLLKIFNGSLENSVLEVLGDEKIIREVIREMRKLGNTFRIILSQENQIVKRGGSGIQKLENLISKKLRVDRANPEVELWFLKRREGNCYLGVRFPKIKETENYLLKGELRQELTHLLCLLSSPLRSDRFLDPFAGSGAIVVERSEYFPYDKIFASDLEKRTFRKLQDRLSNKRNIVIGRWNATNLTSLTDNSIDKIVTDPPWGLYKKEHDDYSIFYKQVLREFSRVIEKGGIAVLLVGKVDFEKALREFPSFELQNELNTLVSGKKATVYKLVKL